MTEKQIKDLQRQVARLTAQRDELLEACKGMVAFADVWLGSMSSEEIKHDHIANAFKAHAKDARAAMAKAEGNR